MTGELKLMEEKLADDNVIFSSQKEMQKITGSRQKHLGAIRISGNGKYQIYLPERPLEVLEMPVMGYIKEVTGLEKDGDVAFVLHNYGKLHEEMHLDNYLEKELAKASGKEFEELSLYDEEVKAEGKTLEHSKHAEGLGIIYTVATIVNAHEYLNGKQMAKDLAEIFPEIKEEAEFLRSYMRGQKKVVWN